MAQSSSNFGTGTAILTNSLTPLTANEFAIFAFAGVYPDSANLPGGSPWTAVGSSAKIFTQNLTGLTPITGAATITAVHDWAAIIASFATTGAVAIRQTQGIIGGGIGFGSHLQAFGLNTLASSTVLVVIIVEGTSVATPPDLTDSQGNIYIPFISLSTGNGKVFLYIASNASAAALTLTVNVTDPAGYSNCESTMYEVTGLAPITATATVTMTPPAITLGQSATLSWSVIGATSQSIDQGIGAVAASGSLTVTPTETTYYNLTALTGGIPIVAFAELQVSYPVLTGSPPFSNGTECVLFWQGTIPKVLNLSTLKVTLPAIRGAPIRSSKRFRYALGKLGFIYMHNGTDMKFFDGVVFRDIGLPALTALQAQNAVASPGLSAITPAQAAAVGGSLTASSGTWGSNAYDRQIFLAFFDITTNQLMTGPTPIHTVTAGLSGTGLLLTGLPVSSGANVVKLLGCTWGGGTNAVMALSGAVTGFGPTWGDGTGPGVFGPVVTTEVDPTTVQMACVAHGLSTGDIVALYVQRVTQNVPPFNSAGPFAVTVIDANTFTFQVPTGQARLYVGFVGNVAPIYQIPSATTTAKLLGPQGFAIPLENMWPDLSGGSGFIQAGIPASSIGGAQPGYQFYGSIYNPIGGQHIGNRFPLAARFLNLAACNVLLTGLPDLSALDSEWVLLIGRTGDGGDIPYAVMDSGGNWVTVPNGQTSIIITQSQIDGNAELPFENNIPPPFATFWREGDRMCGAIPAEPFVYRSGSELDAQTGIFMGDPAQAWPARLVETFPTAAAVIAGAGYMQESWVFTKNDSGQLSELSGETAWNGPYNVGIAGPEAFAQGWSGLPYWVSHDKQLCTMMPGGNGPIPISGEYEAALLGQIGDAYLQKTEMVYYRETVRQIEVLRIKCYDSNGIPFTVIHDFNLRDQTTYSSVARSPYGQAYTEVFLGPLSADYTQFFLRDALGHGRVWAGAGDGNFYQLYLGGDDAGNPHTADALALQYVGAENTAIKTLDWYGDQTVKWFITDKLNTPADPDQMTDLTDQARPVPGEEGNSHYMADIQNPEMTHVYLWMRLKAHPADAPDPTHPTALNNPPHMPVETYGRVLMITPVLGDSRGR